MCECRLSLARDVSVAVALTGCSSATFPFNVGTVTRIVLCAPFCLFHVYRRPGTIHRALVVVYLCPKMSSGWGDNNQVDRFLETRCASGFGELRLVCVQYTHTHSPAPYIFRLQAISGCQSCGALLHESQCLPCNCVRCDLHFMCSIL